jgi:hypothetical protein
MDCSGDTQGYPDNHIEDKIFCTKEDEADILDNGPLVVSIAA